MGFAFWLSESPARWKEKEDSLQSGCLKSAREDLASPWDLLSCSGEKDQIRLCCAVPAISLHPLTTLSQPSAVWQITQTTNLKEGAALFQAYTWKSESTLKFLHLGKKNKTCRWSTPINQNPSGERCSLWSDSLMTYVRGQSWANVC